MAQWIRLRLPPSFGRGFESQTQHMVFAIFNINLNCVVKRTKIDKRRPGLAMFWKSYVSKFKAFYFTDNFTMKNCDFNQRYPLPSKLFRFLKNNLRVAHIKKTQMMSLTFFLFSVILKQKWQFLQQINVKNVRPVFGAGIRTCNFQNKSHPITSRPGLPAF